MRIDIITVLPQLLTGPLDHSIVKRARDKGLVELYIHDLRDFPQINTETLMIMPLEEMPEW